MGALVGHAMLGMNLTLLSMFGVIGLSGVIINNSLMVISFINDRLSEGDDPVKAVIESTLERFRAILLTTLTTFLGVTPIILETSVQAQFLVPTAVSLGFGIIIGTSVLIFTLPALAVLHLRVFGHPEKHDDAKVPEVV
jgi:multidrug efflux pump subunit AcrB